MSCILFPSPIFGPIHSRRLGLSLGVNLLPPSAKVCSFDCVYCECGLNAKNETKPKLPTREEVKTALEKKLAALLSKNMIPDVITFAGNGEPTSHPKFLEIISDTIELRDKYVPNAKISVLSNSTFVNRPSVMEALQLVDNPIMKLDTVNEDFIHLVDRPKADDSARIFCSLSNGNRDALFRKVRDRAGLGPVLDSHGNVIKEGLNFHDGRATFATWAASPDPKTGAPRLDVLALARQTGHKNLKMLQRYYRESAENIAKRLD